MKRGEIWTIAANAYARRPRPAVIVQDDRFSETSSVTVCLVTSNSTDIPHLRVEVEPSPVNGLKNKSKAMADKLMTVSRTKLGARIGRIDLAQMAELDRKLIVFLGLAG